MSDITKRLAALPKMPTGITREGPYRVYKGEQYTVYDDGNSAETPYQTDRAEALEARLSFAVELLRDLQRQIREFCVREGEADFYYGDSREFLAHIDKERKP